MPKTRTRQVRLCRFHNREAQADGPEKEAPKPNPYAEIKDEELFDLGWSVASFLYPRLRRMKGSGCPAIFRPECGEKIWGDLLEGMAVAFELIARDDGAQDFTPEEDLKVERGLNDFRYYFFDLWT